MRILIIGDKYLATNSYSTVWLSFMPTALQKQGCTIGWFPRASQDKYEEWLEALLEVSQQYDHIIAPGVRYFSCLPRGVISVLQSRFHGAVTQICDGALYDKVPVDINFTIKDVPDINEITPRLNESSLTWNIPVGWGADESLFYPEPPEKETLSIFVDHANFDCKTDYSLTIIMNIAQGRSTFLAQGYSQLRVRTLTDDGVIDINLDEISVRPFTRCHVPNEQLAAELRGCDIFIVTHRESIGLTALEAAKCGAYILCPEATIPEDRLMRLPHQVITFPINWQLVLNKPSKVVCAAKVANENWGNVASKIILGLGKWEADAAKEKSLVQTSKTM
ncbi:hypothetical protein ACMV5L_01825 [Serratia plymuthica]|uniref:hypothetical protein n=1 Tax=Serratia plymuthica TaxID=82996 RepID=UPI003DA4C61A